jgi:four helix bundle protein
MRVKISRKESKESRYWLNLICVDDDIIDKERQKLFKEATELMMILSTIIRNSQ